MNEDKFIINVSSGMATGPEKIEDLRKQYIEDLLNPYDIRRIFMKYSL
ncbi:MAG: hypothetical protein ACOC44_14780 [Promethearchaeia archaeon]